MGLAKVVCAGDHLLWIKTKSVKNITGVSCMDLLSPIEATKKNELTEPMG